MAKYKYSNIFGREDFCNGEIWANSDEEAIKIAKEAKAYILLKSIVENLQIVGWKKIYHNPNDTKH